MKNKITKKQAQRIKMRNAIIMNILKVVGVSAMWLALFAFFFMCI